MENREDLCAGIRAEISECRQDEREAQNQILQVIAAAATALSVILGISTFFHEEDPEELLKYLQVLLFLSVTVFCAAMPYAATLGITNILRFQYIRKLEDLLTQINGAEETVIGWMNFSSPITTRNIKHIGSVTTFFHFFCYVFATFSAMAFCVGLTCVQYIQLPRSTPLAIGLVCVELIVTFFLVFIFIFTSLNAKNIMEYAYNKASNARLSRLEKVEKASSHTSGAFLLYLLYPRLKDIHKGFLIIIGYVAGLMLDHSAADISNIWKLIMVWFVFEFLGYQARYQINDLRGVKLDNGKRLPDPSQNAGLSSVVILLRMLLAFGMALFVINDRPNNLVLCLCILFFITILYEYVRGKSEYAIGKKLDRWCSLLLVIVSFGYPLRFFAGMLTALPLFWKNSFSVAGFQLTAFGKILIIIVMALLGEFSVLFPWYAEAQKVQGKDNIKQYYRWLILHSPMHIKQRSFALAVAIICALQFGYRCTWPIVLFELSVMGCMLLICIGEYCAEVLNKNPVPYIISGVAVLGCTGIWQNNFQIICSLPYSRFLLYIQVLVIGVYVAMIFLYECQKIALVKIIISLELQLIRIFAGKESFSWLCEKHSRKSADMEHHTE